SLSDIAQIWPAAVPAAMRARQPRCEARAALTEPRPLGRARPGHPRLFFSDNHRQTETWTPGSSPGEGMFNTRCDLIPKAYRLTPQALSIAASALAKPA